jgi:hypothetical protein
MINEALLIYEYLKLIFSDTLFNYKFRCLYRYISIIENISKMEWISVYKEIIKDHRLYNTKFMRFFNRR